MTSRYPEAGSFFASLETRKVLLDAVRNQLRIERGDPMGSSETGNQCIAYYKIARSNFLGDLQEYAAGLDHGNLESIYMGMEQTRFNHLIEIRNNIGIYLPVFFFFPMQIPIKQTAFPIFVGSALKLDTELQELQKSLKPHENVNIGEVKLHFEATEEDVEDYEASHEGTENFWPCFQCIILESLIKNCIQYKLPIFIF